MNNGLTLVIADKNLSSWSMRPWLVLKAFEIPFQEILIRLDRPSTAQEIQKLSPSGKVPVLMHKDTTIWESLAICEYVADLYPEKNLWPGNPATRGMARSYAAEMLSSFQGMRAELSMNLQLKMKLLHMTSQAVRDIQRVIKLWSQALEQHKGPFLFGDFSIADAFYAPVVFRFKSYGVDIQNKQIIEYMGRIEKHSAVQLWTEAANKEDPYFLKF